MKQTNAWKVVGIQIICWQTGQTSSGFKSQFQEETEVDVKHFPLHWINMHTHTYSCEWRCGLYVYFCPLISGICTPSRNYYALSAKCPVVIAEWFMSSFNKQNNSKWKLERQILYLLEVRVRSSPNLCVQNNILMLFLY